MPNNYEEAIKEAYAVAETEDQSVHTLEFRHSALDAPIYLVQDRQPHDFKLESGEVVTFEPVGFNITLPSSGDNGLQEIDITLDNVSKRITDFIKKVLTADEPVRVYYRPYLLTDPNTPQMNPPMYLNLSDVTITSKTVTGKATFVDVLNRNFPNDKYTRKRFPSLGN